MSTRVLWVIVLVLTFVVIVMGYILFTTPGPTHTSPTATTTPSQQKPAPTPSTTPVKSPLGAQITVASPKSGETVPGTFDVTGEAPGQWYFEATFPIQVRDPNDNVIGRGPANAQGDWMTDKQVAFKMTMNIDGDYSGPATLILMKDNPSGLPENDDSIEIPIVIKQ